MKRGRGRPKFKVTAALRTKVRRLLGCGMTQDQVAAAIGISKPTLRQHFGDVIVTAVAETRSEVLGLLFKAADGGNVSAQKKLEEIGRLHGAAAAIEQADQPPAVAKESAVGKKEQAQRAAESVVADAGDWGSDLNPTTTH